MFQGSSPPSCPAGRGQQVLQDQGPPGAERQPAAAGPEPPPRGEGTRGGGPGAEGGRGGAPRSGEGGGQAVGRCRRCVAHCGEGPPALPPCSFGACPYPRLSRFDLAGAGQGLPVPVQLAPGEENRQPDRVWSRRGPGPLSESERPEHRHAPPSLTWVPACFRVAHVPALLQGRVVPTACFWQLGQGPVPSRLPRHRGSESRCRISWAFRQNWASGPRWGGAGLDGPWGGLPQRAPSSS